jgi:hypothetical protein
MHHLAIGNNVPLDRIASFLRRLGRWAIVEFVPKDDPMTRHLLSARRDVFPTYNIEGFHAAFSHGFRIVEEARVYESLRTIVLLEALETT